MNGRNRRIFLIAAHPGKGRLPERQQPFRLGGGNWSSCPISFSNGSRFGGSVELPPELPFAAAAAKSATLGSTGVAPSMSFFKRGVAKLRSVGGARTSTALFRTDSGRQACGA